MTGLDKIIEQIGNEADIHAKKIMSDAEKQAEQIKQTAEKQADEQCKSIERQSKSDIYDTLNRAKSSAELQKRRTVLNAKQQIISKTIEKAYNFLFKLPDEQYFQLLLKMVKKYSLEENGEIVFSPNDIKRLTNDFQNKIDEQVKEKNVSLKISKQTRPIEGGFILIYGEGEIEQNCTFSALFDASREKMQDKVHELLFS